MGFNLLRKLSNSSIAEGEKIRRVSAWLRFVLFVFLFVFFRNFFGSEGLSSQRKVKILERLLAMLADIPHGYKNRTEVTMKNDISAPACWWANAQYVFCCCLNWVSTIICKCAKWSVLFHFFSFFLKKILIKIFYKKKEEKKKRWTLGWKKNVWMFVDCRQMWMEKGKGAKLLRSVWNPANSNGEC